MNKKFKIVKGDKLTNFMEFIPDKYKSSIKRDKNFKDHLIEPESMIVIAGPTGSGKTNALLEFMKRKNKAWHDIILFSGFSTDEPFYNYLKDKIPDMQQVDRLEQLPDIEDIKKIERKERLLIFDDAVKLDTKSQDTISEWFMAARKRGFTVIYLSQKYLGEKGEAVPIFIRSNINYLILFKFNNDDEVKAILKKYKMNYDLDELLELYKLWTATKGNFLTFDFRKGEIRLNFTGEFA